MPFRKRTAGQCGRFDPTLKEANECGIPPIFPAREEHVNLCHGARGRVLRPQRAPARDPNRSGALWSSNITYEVMAKFAHDCEFATCGPTCKLHTPHFAWRSHLKGSNTRRRMPGCTMSLLGAASSRPPRLVYYLLGGWVSTHTPLDHCTPEGLYSHYRYVHSS